MENDLKIIDGIEMKRSCYPQKRIKEILAVIKEKELRISEAVQMFNVNHATIRNWLLKDSPEMFKPRKKRKSQSEQKAIVRDIQTGLISVEEAVKKYNIARSTVRLWLEVYSCQITAMDMQKAEGAESLSSKEKDKIIKELQLKVMALETLIDLAENSFKIDIRKNSGTKQ